MGIRISDPRNPIILEGLWSLGKTTVGEAYCEAYGYEFVREPIHGDDPETSKITNLDDWYFEKHVAREEYLAKPSELLERSVLSTYAFSYALGRSLPNEDHLLSLQKTIEQNKVLLVYFKDDSDFFSSYIPTRFSEDIRMILSDRTARQRYEDWFTKELPRRYGILPFIVRVTREGGRRSVDDIVRDIHEALACDRTAQANIVCFTRAIDGNKVLILKRNQKKGGFWQTSTGGIHTGENPLVAAQRELWEETGYTNARVSWTDTSYSFVGGEGYILDEYVFAAELPEASMPTTSDEHEAFEWIDQAHAVERVKFESNKDAIRAAVQ